MSTRNTRVIIAGSRTLPMMRVSEPQSRYAKMASRWWTDQPKPCDSGGSMPERPGHFSVRAAHEIEA